MQFVDLAHRFERVDRRCCGTKSSRKATGTRLKTTSAGSFFDQASSRGSNALQCGQLYQKNSMTSILPGGATG